MDKLGAHLVNIYLCYRALTYLPTYIIKHIDHVKNPIWNCLPHFMGTSIFYIPKLKLSKDLTPVSSPVYKDELPENVYCVPYQSGLIPGSFTFRNNNRIVAKAQISQALELGYNCLWHNKLTVLAELTSITLKKPRIHEVILLLEYYFENFGVIHDFNEIKDVAPNPDVLTSIRKKLQFLREEVGDCLVGNGMALSRPPCWGNNHDPEEWWTANNFDILCASYRHEVEGFLETVSP